VHGSDTASIVEGRQDNSDESQHLEEAQEPQGSDGSDAAEDTDTMSEFQYETRLRYSFEYYRQRRSEKDEDEFEEIRAYDEPREFEMKNVRHMLTTLGALQD
jgi:hypothetical protein